MSASRIMIVDDHPIVREGMAVFLNLQDSLDLCCQAASAEEALQAMADHALDLVIVDVSLNGDSGLELIKELRRRHPGIAILTLSMHDEAVFAERALQAGANGYLMKQEGTAHILQAVHTVLSGKTYLSAAMQERLLQRPAMSGHGAQSPLATLSEREFSILHLIGQGFGTREIAEKLGRSVKTIEAHRANLKDKLQLDSGQDLVRFAIQFLTAD